MQAVPRGRSIGRGEQRSGGRATRAAGAVLPARGTREGRPFSQARTHVASWSRQAEQLRPRRWIMQPGWRRPGARGRRLAQNTLANQSSAVRGGAGGSGACTHLRTQAQAEARHSRAHRFPLARSGPLVAGLCGGGRGQDTHNFHTRPAIRQRKQGERGRRVGRLQQLLVGTRGRDEGYTTRGSDGGCW